MKPKKSRLQRLREQAHIIVHGTNTVAGRMFDLVLLCLILLSVLAVMLETVVSFDSKYHIELVLFEWAVTVFFTFEYLLRIVTINKPSKYIFSFYGIIDLLAILPMYLSLFFMDMRIFFIIRVLRLLRLFKIINHPQFSRQSANLKEAVISSRGKIFVFIYVVIISCVVVGSLMYMIEGEKSGFTSIPMGIYWCIVTLTTVGYGDISPATPLGQFLAAFLMILGYGIIAVPTGIVTAEIVKTNLKSKHSATLVCKNCGNSEHLEQAKYCQNCGQQLNND